MLSSNSTNLVPIPLILLIVFNIEIVIRKSQFLTPADNSHSIRNRVIKGVKGGNNLSTEKKKKVEIQ